VVGSDVDGRRANEFERRVGVKVLGKNDKRPRFYDETQEK
jgi:hypothetical protein